MCFQRFSSGGRRARLKPGVLRTPHPSRPPWCPACHSHTVLCSGDSDCNSGGFFQRGENVPTECVFSETKAPMYTHVLVSAGRSTGPHVCTRHQQQCPRALFHGPQRRSTRMRCPPGPAVQGVLGLALVPHMSNRQVCFLEEMVRQSMRKTLQKCPEQNPLPFPVWFRSGFPQQSHPPGASGP